MSLNYDDIMVYSVIERASNAIITRFMVSLKFLIAGGVLLSLIAICRALRDLILFLKASAF
jgi:hypothetical protein